MVMSADGNTSQAGFAHADELFEMSDSGLAYIRSANVQRLWATTTVATPTLSAHDAALLCLWNAARQVRGADVTCPAQLQYWAVVRKQAPEPVCTMSHSSHVCTMSHSSHVCTMSHSSPMCTMSHSSHACTMSHSSIGSAMSPEPAISKQCCDVARAYILHARLRIGISR
jgi:hypothetical protein